MTAVGTKGSRGVRTLNLHFCRKKESDHNKYFGADPRHSPNRSVQGANRNLINLKFRILQSKFVEDAAFLSFLGSTLFRKSE